MSAKFPRGGGGGSRTFFSSKSKKSVFVFVLFLFIQGAKEFDRMLLVEGTAHYLSVRGWPAEM